MTVSSPAPAAEDARQRASGSSFYAAMRIMPRGQREAMFEIYAFCRAVDDIADEGGARDCGSRSCSAGATTSTRSTPASRRRIWPAWPTPSATSISQREDSSPSSTAWRWTWSPTIRAPDLATLDLYCDRVASAVGRLSVRVFGMEQDDGLRAGAPSRPRAAAHQHPARPRRGCRDRPALSAARGAAATPASRHRSATTCWRIRRSARPARRSSRAPRSISHRPTTSWRAARDARCRTPRIMAAAYRHDARRA